VIIAKIDADSHKESGSKFGVSGYPTLKYFPAGGADPISCDEREVDGLVDFINANAGTARNKDGGLRLSAGRVTELDSIVKGGVVDATVLTQLKSAVTALEGKSVEYGAFYVSIAEKILEKGKAYVETEGKRMANMLTNKGIVAAKKTGFALKKNILAAFA
jgi:protein disulfide-isomerase A6